METEKSNTGKIVSGVIVLVVLFILFITSFTIVGAGERGIIVLFGQVQDEIGSGSHFVNPISNVVKLDVQTQKEQSNASAASKDLQDVSTTIAVNYNLIPEKVSDLYIKVGEDYKSRIIDPAIQEVVKASTAKYTAEELVTKRQIVTDEMQSALKEKLLTNNIVVTGVSIIDFKFSPSFTQAIEAKVTAEQNALAAKNNVDKATYEAQSIKIKSEAANNEKYIQLQTLEVEKAAIEKWDGHLPNQMIPGQAVPFINLAK